MLSFVGVRSAASMAAVSTSTMPTAAAGLKHFGTRVSNISSQPKSPSTHANRKNSKLSTEPTKHYPIEGYPVWVPGSAPSSPKPSPKRRSPQLSTQPIAGWKTWVQHKIKGPSVWTGEDLKKDPWWGHMLTPQDVDDLFEATQVAKKSARWLLEGVPDIVPKEAFPISLAMTQKLEAVRDQLENGKGLVMIRNMPVQDPRFTEDDLAIMYLGISAHIGHIVLQSSSGLRSVSRGYGLPLGRVQAEMTGETPKGGKQTNNHFRYHTDRCDVISLMSIRPAPSGGASRVCSAPAIFNALVDRDPELAHTLTQPIDRIWEGENGFFRLPVMGLTPWGKFTTQISPSYVENAQFLEKTVKATPTQIRALDAIEDIGMELGAEFMMKPGMLYFLNNHQVYHGRGNWAVTEEESKGQWGAKGRLLFRTWISPFNSRELPDEEQYRFVWGSVEGGSPRGGYDQALQTGEVPKPAIPADHKYYSLYSEATQQRSMQEHCATVLSYD